MEHASERAGGSDQVATFLLFTTVAVAPLPFGSVDPGVVALWCVVLGLALLAAPTRKVRNGYWPLLATLGLIVAAFGLVLSGQLASAPWLSVSPHPIWRATQDVLGGRVLPSVSVALHQPFFALGAPLAAMASLLCSGIVCADRQRAHQLLRLATWSGTAYAALGIIQFLVEPNRVLWREKIAYFDAVTGPFISRNTAAVYFGACGTVCLVLLVHQVNSWRSRALAEKSEFALFDLIARWDVRAELLRFLVCVTAMLMTRSRAGVVFSAAGMVVGFSALYWRSTGWRGRLLVPIAAAATVALVVLQVIAGGIGDRFEQSGLGDVARFDTYRSTVRMIAEHPWLGTGLGTFALSFPPYRSDEISVWGIWDRAHDTLLEIAAEMGVPFAALVAAGWLVVVLTLLGGVRKRRRDLVVPVSALAVAVISLLHSVVDFSLQIPGYAIVIFALVGAGLAQSFPSDRRARVGAERSGAQPEAAPDSLQDSQFQG
jgi:O-antigen ligase